MFLRTQRALLATTVAILVAITALGATILTAGESAGEIARAEQAAEPTDPRAPGAGLAPVPDVPADVVVESDESVPVKGGRIPSRAIELEFDDDDILQAYGIDPEAWQVGTLGIDAETQLVTPPQPAYDPWLPVRMCESNNNYAINTGNGFYGAYQFTLGTWNWVASQVLPAYNGVRPDLAPAWAQDRMAQALAFEVSGGGLHHWPICGQRYGS